MHDPTSFNRQGNDYGTQYRSAIFTTSAQQAAEARETKAIYQAALNKEGLGKIVTDIEDASLYPYWLAENYHQRYLYKNPNGYDCHSSTGVEFPSVSERVS
jgi:peptide-methionine (S)-S-oxide reductase